MKDRQPLIGPPKTLDGTCILRKLPLQALGDPKGRRKLLAGFSEVTHIVMNSS
jgi:hypothetical protein